MTPLEIMLAILSASAHDIDHPGVNQGFLIATNNHLADLYQVSRTLIRSNWKSCARYLFAHSAPGFSRWHHLHTFSLRLRSWENIWKKVVHITFWATFLPICCHIKQTTAPGIQNGNKLIIIQMKSWCAKPDKSKCVESHVVVSGYWP
jgi:hypothetical protein